MRADMEGKIEYGVGGLVCGAIVAMIIGFGWGGWVTAGTSQKTSDSAVLASQAAICVAQFMKDPSRVKELEGIESWKRSEFIEKGGWNKMPGQKEAGFGVANACVTGLEVLIKK